VAGRQAVAVDARRWQAEQYSQAYWTGVPSLPKKLTISFPNGCQIACSKSVFGMDNELYIYITETFL